jgi:hypothetical protein
MAVAAEVRFYVDESLLGLGKALNYARRDVIHVGHPLIPQAPLGALDPDWMPVVAKRNLVVIARDRHIRTRPGEIGRFVEHGLRAFWIAGRKDLTNWLYLKRLVARWDDIEAVLATRPTGPWMYAINESSLSELSIPH